MSKRIFIFSEQKFPRGSAGANYIEYLSLALTSMGWKVIVIGYGNNNESDKSKGKYIYKGIEYFNEKAEWGVFDKKYDYIKLVEDKYNITKEDYAVIYSMNYFIIQRVCERFPTSHITCVLVERMQPYQFKAGALNPRYIFYARAERFVKRKIEKILPISKHLEHMYSTPGRRSLCIPIMANPYEYGYVDKKKEKVIRFIYPGMKVTGYEDLPELMIRAIDEVKKEIGAEIELHITGMKKESISEWATGKNITIPADAVIFHEWLDYAELIKLYSTVDFLLLARRDNEITNANFPSKVPELMSFGVIPVCSDVGDYTKYYLEDGVNSIIFKPDSFEDCKAAVRRACMLSEEQYSNMRRSARQLVEDKFYYGNWAQQINDFLLDKES